MARMLRRCQLLAFLVVSAPAIYPLAAAQSFPLDSAKGLEPIGVSIQPVTYQGRKAVRLTELAASQGGGVAVLSAASFHDGVLEVELAGKPAQGASGDARGFVGIAFRTAPDASRYECVYLRPTNGRADDQLRRNHSTQYISIPEYEWFRLRSETPGKYESYVDLVPGEWTKLRIEVSGVKLRLYVNGSPQPVLLVNDLKHGDSTGAIALWIGPGTEAYFSNLRLTP
ncbi:hypothetical protein DYQ86_23140 [Acidobacteria bacterium AB60]|nr:hypothetical protein DYQ86_23140 [Acidobacteria bacterium AB60]